MPIVYIHGVNVREPFDWSGIRVFLRRYVAPKLNPAAPDDVAIDAVFWGDHAARFAWNMQSLPGNSVAIAMGKAPDPSADETWRLVSLAAGSDAANPKAARAVAAPAALRAGPRVTFGVVLTREQIVDVLIAATFPQSRRADAPADVQADEEWAKQAAAIDDVVGERVVDSAELTPEFVAEILRSVQERTEQPRAQGENFFARAQARVEDALGSFGDRGALAAARMSMPVRRNANTFVSRFCGDVFSYLRSRDDGADAGCVPRRLMDKLIEVRARSPHDEPMVLLSHSMGGQISYDVLSYYAERYEGWGTMQVDVWAAAASQVGYFEELKLHRLACADWGASPKTKAPKPQRVKLWWNVWDPADFASYTAARVFDGVTDQAFGSGLSPVDAHGGYLIAPRFYRLLAAKVAESRTIA